MTTERVLIKWRNSKVIGIKGTKRYHGVCGKIRLEMYEGARPVKAQD